MKIDSFSKRLRSFTLRFDLQCLEGGWRSKKARKIYKMHRTEMNHNICTKYNGVNTEIWRWSKAIMETLMLYLIYNGSLPFFIGHIFARKAWYSPHSPQNSYNNTLFSFSASARSHDTNQRDGCQHIFIFYCYWYLGLKSCTWIRSLKEHMLEKRQRWELIQEIVLLIPMLLRCYSVLKIIFVKTHKDWERKRQEKKCMKPDSQKIIDEFREKQTISSSPWLWQDYAGTI